MGAFVVSICLEEGARGSGCFPGCRIRCSWFCAFLNLTCPHPDLPPLAGEGARGFGCFPGCGVRSSRFRLFPRLRVRCSSIGAFAACQGEVDTKLMISQPAHQARQRFVGDTPSPASGGGLGWGQTIYLSAYQARQRIVGGTPSPASGGGLGWGICCLNLLGGRSSRFRFFPRLRSKELEVLAVSPAAGLGARGLALAQLARVWLIQN